MTEDTLQFLTRNENELLLAVAVFVLFSSAMFEAIRPRRNQSREQLARRWPANLSLMIVGQLNTSFVASIAAVVIAAWGGEAEFGLAGYLDLGFWTSVLLACLLFEFFTYWFHRALHAVPLLWRIHAVHHSDTEIDFSTTFRNHPLELLVIAPITVPLVYLVGFPAAAVVCYQLIKSVLLVFAHSNVLLPGRVDRVVRWFFATPDYHRIHHSTDQRYTDSNFATTFPIYDYVFGTYRSRPTIEIGEMPVGLEYLSRPVDTRLSRLLLLPFVWSKVVGPRRSAAATSETATG